MKDWWEDAPLADEDEWWSNAPLAEPDPVGLDGLPESSGAGALPEDEDMPSTLRVRQAQRFTSARGPGQPDEANAAPAPSEDVADGGKLVPFDPERHKPQDIGLGGPSTEYIIGVEDDQGKPMNIPSIWWDEGGSPHQLSAREARGRALEYERETGKRFPRFKSIKEADKAAAMRSQQGGATETPLARDNSVAPRFLDETDELRANRSFGRSAYNDDGRLSHIRPNDLAFESEKQDAAGADQPAMAASAAGWNPESEIGKGVKTGVIGIKQIGTALGTIPYSQLEQNNMEMLRNFDRVRGMKPGASEAEIAAALGYDMADPGARVQVSLAKQFLDADESRRIGIVSEISENILANEKVKTGLIDAIKAYSAEMQETQGRVPNFTDIETRRDFADWFAFNSGQALPYLAGLAAAGVFGGTPAIVGSGYALGVGDIQSGLVEEGVESRGDIALLAGVPYASLEAIGPVARPFRKIGTKTLQNVASSYFKRTLREVPANAVEEFINEAGQEIIKDYAVAEGTGKPVEVTEEALLRWFNSGMAGAAAGVSASPVTAAVPSETLQPSPPDDSEPLNLKPGDEDSPIPDDVISEGRKALDEIEARKNDPVQPVTPIDEGGANARTPAQDVAQAPLPTDRLSPARPDAPAPGAAPETPQEASAPTADQAPLAPEQIKPGQKVRARFGGNEPVSGEIIRMTSEGPVFRDEAGDEFVVPVEDLEDGESAIFPQVDEAETLPEVDEDGNETGRMVRYDPATGAITPVQQEANDQASQDSQQKTPNRDVLEAARPEPSRSGPVVTLENDDLTAIESDPETFQYKSNADKDGRTDRLKGVKKWDVTRAGVGIVYEDRSGRRRIADGHQRLGLARDLRAKGQDVSMPVIIRREADGYTAQGVMVEAALKNIAESPNLTSADPQLTVDAAKVMRAQPQMTADDMNLPPKSALVRHAGNLRKLSDDAFGMVINDPDMMRNASVVGKVVQDQSVQANILGMMNKLPIKNEFQAEQVARQAAADTAVSTQDSLFGEQDVAESLYLERARILDMATKRLKKDKQTFKTLVEREGSISEAGNRLDQKANKKRLQDDAFVQEYLTRQANTKGPISDALSEAARDLKQGGNAGQAVTRVINAVRSANEGDRQAGEGKPADGRRDEPQGKGSPREEVAPDKADKTDKTTTERTEPGEQDRPSSDPLRRKGDWQDADIVAENEDGTEVEISAKTAVRELFRQLDRANRLKRCLNA